VELGIKPIGNCFYYLPVPGVLLRRAAGSSTFRSLRSGWSRGKEENIFLIEASHSSTTA